MKCKILVDYSAAEGWKVGDIVDITDPSKLIQEGKVVEYAESNGVNTNLQTPTRARASKKVAKKTDL